MGFRFDSSTLLSGLEAFRTREQVALLMYAQTVSVKLQGYAQTSAPWTDRTGMARKTLNSYIEEGKNNIRIYLAHGVDYGQWLELGANKKYAVIQPTIDLRSQEILNGLQNLFEAMQTGGK